MKTKEKKPTIKSLVQKNKRLEQKLKKTSKINTTVRVASLLGIILAVYKRHWGLGIISTAGLVFSIAMPAAVDSFYTSALTLGVALLHSLYYMLQPFVEKKINFKKTR